VSTDKAVNPTNVMGATKRVAELIWGACQQRESEQGWGGTLFAAVRFGNVLGSSGSVIPTFRAQIANGGPVTVTHPEINRFFMSIPEAAGLILQSALLSKGGEMFVLDMGEPIRIQDLARQMIELCGFKPDEDIRIEFTGLRPGEKLYEEPIHQSENIEVTKHPKVRLLVNGAPSEDAGIFSSVEEMRSRLGEASEAELLEWLSRTVPEYTAGGSRGKSVNPPEDSIPAGNPGR
jgi:FlaA1/EpsC-like NDP-sugar epimerase